MSVLLAFSTGRWQDKVNKEERVEHALQNIRAEIQENRDEVEPLIEIHKNLIIKTYQIPDSVFQDKSAWELFRYSLDNKNPRLPWVEKSAFEAAIFSGILQNMEYDLLTEISTLYNLQGKGIDKLFDQFSAMMCEPAFYDPDHAREYLQAVQMLMQSMYGNEMTYSKSCDTVLAKIDSVQKQ